MTDTLYDTDFVAWTERQAEELRRAARERANAPLDWINLAEEIESLGKRDRREAESYVRQILIHLAKLTCSPDQAPRSHWIGEIGAFRFSLQGVLQDSPSLRGKLEGNLEAAAGRALREVSRAFDERGEAVDAELLLQRLRSLTLDEILDEGFIPERTPET